LCWVKSGQVGVKSGQFRLLADISPTPDGDGAINIGDLLFIITHWGATGNHSADVTFDGSVGIADLLAVIAAWGACR
jgi:hypothetical protein